jgi:hypothetical protein
LYAVNVANRGAPICEVFHIPETGLYGFAYRFEGRPPHFLIDTCQTLQDVLDHCDAHREHVWEETSDADETRS